MITEEQIRDAFSTLLTAAKTGVSRCQIHDEQIREMAIEGQLSSALLGAIGYLLAQEPPMLDEIRGILQLQQEWREDHRRAPTHAGTKSIALPKIDLGTPFGTD